jgi:hypothetical protein
MIGPATLCWYSYLSLEGYEFFPLRRTTTPHNNAIRGRVVGVWSHMDILFGELDREEHERTHAPRLDNQQRLANNSIFRALDDSSHHDGIIISSPRVLTIL